MKAIKVLSIVALFCILFTSVMTGCATVTDDPNSTTTASPDQTTEATDAGFKFESWSISGEDISKYTIIYNPTLSADLVSKYKQFLNDEYDHNRVTAQRLADLISANFGVELSVRPDTSTAVGEYEILVGMTNRAETKTSTVTSLSEDAYVLAVSGKKLVVCGGCAGSTYHAVDAIETSFEQAKASKTAKVEWTDTTNLSGEYKMKRIACIGDSITEGAGATDKAYLAYPAQLQRIVWRDYLVYNYGKGGTTMRTDRGNPYMNSEPYSNCIKSGKSYDLILVMLGTNDSYKRTEPFNDADNQAFVSSCFTLFRSLKAKSPNAKYVLMNCPVNFADYGHAQPYIRDVQKTAAISMNERGFETYLYNMFEFTTKFLGKENFPDKTHPGDKGYMLIAGAVADLVAAVMDGEENEYMIPLD